MQHNTNANTPNSYKSQIANQWRSLLTSYILPTSSQTSPSTSPPSSTASSFTEDPIPSDFNLSYLKSTTNRNSSNLKLDLQQDQFCLVEGVFSKDFGELGDKLGKKVKVKLSRFKSIHDRACELFFQLKGGKTNYGHHHAKTCLHSQYGPYYSGILPHWSQNSPIVLVGVEYGVPTCQYLQYLLSIDYFKLDTNSSWIKGIISVSGLHRGSPLPYLMGLIPNANSLLYPITILQFLIVLIHIIVYFDFAFLNFDLNNGYKMSRKEGASLINAMFGKSTWIYSGDNFLVDYSIEGNAKYSGLFYLHPDTIYINYIVSTTIKSKVSGRHLPNLLYNMWSIPVTFLLGTFNWEDNYNNFIINTRKSFEFWKSDGVVPTISQIPSNHQTIKFEFDLTSNWLDPLINPVKGGGWYNVFVKDPKIMTIYQAKEKTEPSVITVYYIRLLTYLNLVMMWWFEHMEQILAYLGSFRGEFWDEARVARLEVGKGVRGNLSIEYFRLAESNHFTQSPSNALRDLERFEKKSTHGQ